MKKNLKPGGLSRVRFAKFVKDNLCPNCGSDKWKMDDHMSYGKFYYTQNSCACKTVWSETYVLKEVTIECI